MLTMGVFESLDNPSKEYTPIPFWFWNDDLSEIEIDRQMMEMKDKGIDAFVIHPRKGLPLSVQYLSDSWFSYVRFTVKRAKELDMKVVLYDEAMYPSGSCHGEVVKRNSSFASKGLLKEGDVYTLIESGGTIRGVHDLEDDGEENAPRSVDLLNPEAVKCFIELTHERYYKELKEYFGDTIIAFFTDEPNILGRNAREDVIPWSDGILEEFMAAGGRQEYLAYLFKVVDSITAQNDSDSLNIDTNNKNRAKEIYKKVIYNRLSNSYYKQLSDWCENHGIALTGHPEKSTDIGYLKYFQIPCQDIVWRFVEPEDQHYIVGEHSTMGKCSSDSARHRGKRRNGNECFGCCGHRDDPYLFTEDDMRWYLNWLFIRGVNLVFPHAFYYSVRDGRGDERPPEVGMHNPFWPEYKRLSDYIKRMCFLNTDAQNLSKVAVLCSFDALSHKIARPLFENQIEFNYLETELLSGTEVNDGVLSIEGYSYKVVLADRKTYEGMSLKDERKLEEFEKCGGCLMILVEDNITESDLSNIRQKAGLEISFSGDTENLRVSHLKNGEDEYMLLCNEGLESISFKYGFGAYKAEKFIDMYSYQERPDFNNGAMELKPYEMVLVLLKKD